MFVENDLNKLLPNIWSFENMHVLMNLRYSDSGVYNIKIKYIIKTLIV